MSDEVDFLHVGKYESLLQIDNMILMGIVKHSQSFQNSKFTMSLQYLKKEVRDEVDFLHVDKHQSFLQVDFNTLGIKDAYKVILSLLLGMIKHSQSTQSNKFAISLQYLKKEVRKGVNFLHADENQSFYKLKLLFLIEMARYVQSNPSRKLVMFLPRVLQPSWCSVLMQNIQIFYGVPAMFIVTCLLAHPDCRNFLPGHYNKIIKQQLCGEELPSSLPLLQVDVFQEKQGILQQIILCSSNKPKKACIRPSDTNNFTQSLTRKYHHSATESLYCLCGAKIS